MPADLDAAERFVHTNARLLDRHRLAVLLYGQPVDPVLQTLHAYQNPDGGYWVKFALDFLDHVPDQARATAAIDRLRSHFGDDGSMPITGGAEGERLTPLSISGWPGRRSRALFSDDQIEADLGQLERGQQDDGGWTFDWAEWSPGQSVEWRGVVTLRALATLAAHERIRLPRGGLA